MSDVATRGPNYDWKHEAEHYRDECDKIRALLHKIDSSADMRIYELERDLATAQARVKVLKMRGEELAGFIADTTNGRCLCEPEENHKCRDCLSEELMNAWDEALSQPPTADMWKPNTLSVPIDDKAMRDAVKKLEEDLTRGDLK
jgi:hypothetical protein